MSKGVFSRVADIVRADINDLLSRMEDPPKMVRQMILDMEEGVNEAVAAVSQAIVNKKVLERKIRERRERAAGWQKKAEEAVAAGEEELARQALQQKVDIDAIVEDLEGSLEEAGKVTAELRQQLVRFKAKLQEARTRERTLILQCKTAQQRRDVAQRPRVTRADAFERFDAFCGEVEREEGEASVYEEVAGSRPMLDAAFDKLERKTRVDEELRALKQKLGATGNADSDGGQA